MFIGHFAVAFAAKRVAPAVSLGTLFVACELVDLIWPVFVLAPGAGARIGLGLWNSVPATLALEGLMFFAALFFYLKGTRARDRIGQIGFWALIAFLLAAYCGAAFGPPPPNVETVAWAGIAGGIVTALGGYWVDRHRAVAPE